MPSHSTSQYDEIGIEKTAAWRMYLLLALVDRRDGSAFAELVHMAREAFEREATEPDACDQFDAVWGRYTSSERLELARRQA